MIALETEKKEFVSVAIIKVIGIGGAGGNTVNSMVDVGYDGFECIVANTDAQALDLSKADTKLQIGIKSTKGLGTGANPEIGQRAAEEDLDKIMEAIGEADIVFLAAGMGGGTGSGAAPVIARALREKGILSIAIVTKPFLFEGKRRSQIALEAVETLRKEVDTMIVLPNQKLLDVVDRNVSMIDAFGMINEVLGQSVRGISDIITRPGHINVDFADVRAIMRDRGIAVMGTGKASGEDRAQKAAEMAIASPLLENVSIKGAHGVLLNITGGKDLGLHEISQAASVIYDQAHEDANIILGSVIDESLDNEVVVTIIATGCQGDQSAHQAEQVQATVLDHSSAEQEATEIQVAEQGLEQEAQPEPIQHQEKPAQVAQEKRIAPEVLEMSSEIDLNDLDVPAYLRKQAHQDDVNN